MKKPGRLPLPDPLPVAAAEAPTSFVRAALAIFGVALAVRLMHLWQMAGTPYFRTLMGDASGYHEWGTRIAAGDWMGDDVFYQAPLYPYFAGAIYSIFGVEPSALRVAQAAVGAASCVLLALAGRRWFSTRVGVVAGLGLALYAPAIFFDGLVQKSVLDVFFVCAALAVSAAVDRALARAPDDPGRRRSRLAAPAATFALGAIVACLSLTRENALLLVAVLGVWVWWRALAAGVSGPAILGLFLGGVVVVLGPVAARNYAVGGEAFPTTSQFGPNFYIGNNSTADGTYRPLRFGRGSPEHERTDATELAERARGRRLTPGEVSSYWSEQALAFITARPADWVGLQVRKLALLVNATEMLDTESQESHSEWSALLRLLGPVMNFGVLVPLAVAGVWMTWHARRRLWVLHAIGATFALGTVMFYVFARYRYPLVPLLLLFAAAALVQGPGFVTRTPLRRMAPMAVIVAAFALLARLPLLSSDTMRAISETNLGAALHEAGRLPEAVARYRRALAIRSDYAPAYNNLGVALRAQGRIDEAIRAYEDGLRVHADYPDLHYNLANALLERDRADEAVSHLRAASRTNPQAASVRNNLGMALARTGDLTRALAEFRAAVALDPSSALAHRNLGNALASAGERVEALTYLERAVRLDPADADAHYDLGHALMEAGRLEAAAAAFREALALRPQSVAAMNNLGIALASMGRLDEAIVAWERALALEPGFADARENLERARRLPRRR